jgi:hypothetical protein
LFKNTLTITLFIFRLISSIYETPPPMPKGQNYPEEVTRVGCHTLVWVAVVGFMGNSAAADTLVVGEARAKNLWLMR